MKRLLVAVRLRPGATVAVAVIGRRGRRVALVVGPIRRRPGRASATPVPPVRGPLGGATRTVRYDEHGELAGVIWDWNPNVEPDAGPATPAPPRSLPFAMYVEYYADDGDGAGVLTGSRFFPTT